MRQRQSLERTIIDMKTLERDYDDALTLIELGETEGDEASIAEGEMALKRIDGEAQRRSVEALLSGEADGMNTYLEVHAGAGGTESQDWASMLARMYMRWAERRGFKVKLIDESAGEEAGIKSATMEIEGENAYGWLKTEAGVHRLVRISPYDSNARRHTSFASVTVYPVIDDTIDIEINPADVDISFARSSGAGGQHVNRTESAVRLVHKPSGIVIFAQEQRSQHQNKDIAFKRLKARLYEHGIEAARGKGVRRAGVQDRYRLGPPDPLVRVAALSAGQGPAHRRAIDEPRRCARRRYRSLDRGRSGAAHQRRQRRCGRGPRIADTALHRPQSRALYCGAECGHLEVSGDGPVATFQCRRQTVASARLRSTMASVRPRHTGPGKF